MRFEFGTLATYKPKDVLGYHASYAEAAGALSARLGNDVERLLKDGSLSAGDQQVLAADVAQLLTAQAAAQILRAGGNLDNFSPLPISVSLVVELDASGHWRYGFEGAHRDGLESISRDRWPNGQLYGDARLGDLIDLVNGYLKINYFGVCGTPPTLGSRQDVAGAARHARSQLASLFAHVPGAKDALAKLSDGDALRVLSRLYLGETTHPALPGFDRANAQTLAIRVGQAKGPVLGASHYIVQNGWALDYQAKELGYQFVDQSLRMASLGWSLGDMPPEVQARLKNEFKDVHALLGQPNATFGSLSSQPKVKAAWQMVMNGYIYNLQRALFSDTTDVGRQNVLSLRNALLMRNPLFNANVIQEGSMVVLPQPDDFLSTLNLDGHEDFFHSSSVQWN